MNSFIQPSACTCLSTSQHHKVIWLIKNSHKKVFSNTLTLTLTVSFQVYQFNITTTITLSLLRTCSLSSFWAIALAATCRPSHPFHRNVYVAPCRPPKQSPTHPPITCFPFTFTFLCLTTFSLYRPHVPAARSGFYSAIYIH